MTRFGSRRKHQIILTFLALLELIYPHASANAATAPEALEGGEHQHENITMNEVVPETPATSVSCPLIEDCRLPDVADRPVKKTMYVTVTAYSSSVDETDGDPFTTASGSRTKMGTLAYNFLPFGSKVKFPDAFGDQVFTVLDRLNPRASRNHYDIWLPSKAEAIQWGVRVIRVEIL